MKRFLFVVLIVAVFLQGCAVMAPVEEGEAVQNMLPGPGDLDGFDRGDIMTYAPPFGPFDGGPYLSE